MDKEAKRNPTLSASDSSNDEEEDKFESPSDKKKQGKKKQQRQTKSRKKPLKIPQKCSWEVEGNKILSGCKRNLLSRYEKKVLLKLVRQGCPSTYRGKLWVAASGAQAALHNNPNYYANLKGHFIEYPSPAYAQIELDLDRTFFDPSSPHSAAQRETLKNILYCYAKRNPTVGYCQGMNYLVAHLLRYMEEEEAFWTLCCLVEYLLPLDYYTAMIGILVDQKLFTLLVKEMMPSLSTTFEKLNLDPSLVSLQWFVCLFSYNLQSEVSDVIWDHLFLQGSKALFRAGLSMVSLIERNILKCSEFSKLAEAFATLEKEPRSFTDVSALVQTMNLKKFAKITNQYVERYRNKLVPKVYEELNKTNERKKFINNVSPKLTYLGKLVLYDIGEIEDASEELLKVDKITCSTKWPVCIFDHTRKISCPTYFSFRIGQPLELIEEYFGVVGRKEAGSEVEGTGKVVKDQYPELLIERNLHYCTNEEFVAKLNAALEEEAVMAEVFPPKYVNIPMGEEFKYIGFMERYMKHVESCKIAVKTMEEQKTEEKSYTTGVVPNTSVEKVRDAKDPEFVNNLI